MSLLRKHSARKQGTIKKSKSKCEDIEYMVQDLATLRRKRTIAYKRLAKALEIGELATNNDVQCNLFLSYHQELNQMVSNFEDSHFTILEIIDDPEKEDNEIQERFDEMYFQVLSLHRTLTKNESVLNSQHLHSGSTSNIRLPKIVLPSFSGNIKQWPEYYDTFNALIHNCSSISDTEKFHYLISSLSGDALSVVKAFPMTHEHYSDAYQALVARYKSKRTLAFTCWRDILNIDLKSNNACEFQKSLDLFEENLSILKTIDLPVNQWDFVLVYHILSKLDKDLRRDFEEKYSDTELPSYEQLKKFLRSKCEALLRDTHFSEPYKSNKPLPKITQQPFKRITASHTLVTATAATNQQQQNENDSTFKSYSIKCAFCNGSHSISSCQDFLNKSLDERMTIANQKNWCFNCLKPSHQLKNCNSIFSCRTCKRKHHTLLHRDKSNIEPNHIESSLVSRSQSNVTVLLATAIVQVQDESGNMQSFRALFDTGSQSNFITESAVNRLNLKPIATNAKVSGLGAASAPIIGDITCSVGNNDRVLFKLDMHVISEICGNQPTVQLNTSGWSHIKSLPLGDSGFDTPESVDILFAADVFADSLLNEHIKGDADQPTAFNSLFGWLLLGKTCQSSNSLKHTLPDINNHINSLAQRFCEIDSIPTSIMLSPNDRDDTTSSFQGLENVQEAKSQVIAPFNRGCFQLRKWVNNNPQLLADLPSEYCLAGSVSLDKPESQTLNILKPKWDPSSDEFLFEIKPSDRPYSKHYILSEDAKIFDPLGILSPITIKAKCLIQQLWIPGVGWDQIPPDKVIRLRAIWNTYLQQLSSLSQLRILRQLIFTNVKSCELHWFCHNSEIVYGAIIYLRITDADDKVHVFMVCSKAHVASPERTSFPRLELCAAVTLSDLYKFVRDILVSEIHVDAVYLWSDPVFVLSWLRSHSSRWATFVGNHVSSSENPADICSRGQYLNELLCNSLWWAGPYWLLQDQQSWPISTANISHKEDVTIAVEERKSVLLTTTADATVEPSIFDNLLTRFSSLEKLGNTIAYVYRFIHNCRNPNQANRTVFLNNVERHNALMQIVKHVQSINFANEIANLKSKKPLSKPFRKLNPFIDSQGILRVGGRISRSGLEYEQRHPAFLPSDHPLTFLIIDFIHRNYLHPGINTTHYLLLQQFWIISAKSTIRRRLAKCIPCYRLNPRPLQPFMSDLPSYRLNQVKPFSVVGVDFGGPFRIKLGPHRGAKIDKAYLCLFICLATKAGHLEVVSTLSTDGFIAALRRFVARRGRCNVIHADCGTNFVGARNQLSAYMHQASNAEKIEFKFNSPSAPHFGGVWEIQIKAAKSHLFRVVGDQVLTFEELSTLFAQIESTLNSRPLCPISSDPNDLSVLTPGHFLTLEPLTAVPDEDLSNIKVTRLQRWQLLQSFHQSFWSRWKHEYLNTLTQRAKWTQDSNPLKVGAMVMIKDDNRAPLQWPLARVVKLLPGVDGITRIAEVRTAKNNIIQRPLVKLCPLPLED